MRVVVICGGQSPEHKIALTSARNILAHMPKVDLRVVVIARDGTWCLLASVRDLNGLDEVHNGMQIGQPCSLARSSDGVYLATEKTQEIIDLVFPVCHGPLGEDGTLQGMLTMLGVPYVGTDYKSAMLAMDKDLFKRMMQQAGLPVVPAMVLTKGGRVSWDEVSQKLCASCFFVKPTDMGSSVGISRVTNEGELQLALDEAFRYGSKLIIEPAFEGIELECAVRGKEKLEASVVGQIKNTGQWYDYKAKYAIDSSASTCVPAAIPESVSEQVRCLSIKACQVIGCTVMARVDFFYHPEKGLVINEVNTIPGFTSISLYPKLWVHTGVTTHDLLYDMLSSSLGERHADSQLS